MNFPDFYTLLNSIIDKKKVDIEPNNDNFSFYLASRYLSFYHPSVCILINTFANKIDQTFISPKEGYEYLFNMVPKMPRKKIEYIRKNVSEIARKNNIDDEDLIYEAKNREMSKKEILDLINFSNELDKNVVK